MKQKGQRSIRARARLEFRKKGIRASLRHGHTRPASSLDAPGGVPAGMDFVSEVGLTSHRLSAKLRGKNRRSTRHRSHLNGFDNDDENGDIIPTAPPLEVLDTVLGYEELTFEAVSIPPPDESLAGDFELPDPDPGGEQILGNCPALFDESSQAPTSTPISRITIPILTETMARSALVNYVKSQCCWGPQAARNMSITSLRHTSSYHYILHTFTEKREARWTWSPHVGGDVDGPEGGTAPTPWEIPASPAKPFNSEIKAIEVPHTASVKPCHRCRGVGTLACSACHGKGWTRCHTCQGEGWGFGDSRDSRCLVCGTSSHGHGRQDCNRCGSKGRVSCTLCDSYGQLKCFIQLTISWKVSIGEHVTGGGGDIPDELLELIRQVSGQIGMEETGLKLNSLPAELIVDETMAMASAQLINEHLNNTSDALLLAQRHQVRVVPVFIVDYQFKRHGGSYFIYGLEKKVYAPDYPQTCCCGCVII